MSTDLAAAPVLVDPAELAYLRGIETAARDLVRKLNQHERQRWERIKLGALHPLRAAVDARVTAPLTAEEI